MLHHARRSGTGSVVVTATCCNDASVSKYHETNKRKVDTFLGEETAKIQTYTSISKNYWDQKVAAIMKFCVVDDEENDELENDIRSFVDKTSHLTTAVLRRGVEMSML